MCAGKDIEGFCSGGGLQEDVDPGCDVADEEWGVCWVEGCVECACCVCV